MRAFTSSRSIATSSHLLRAKIVAQPGLHRQVGDSQVLGGEALGGVHDDDRDVRPLRGALRADLRVELDGAGDPRALAKARGVHQEHRAVADLKLGVDRVARRAGDVGDDHPVRAQEAVDERGLADVRAADQRQARAVGLVLGARDRARAAPPRGGRGGPRSNGPARPRRPPARPGRGCRGRPPAARPPGRRPCWRRPPRGRRSAAGSRRPPRRPGARPALASRTSATTSASAIAARACSWIAREI